VETETDLVLCHPIMINFSLVSFQAFGSVKSSRHTSRHHSKHGSPSHQKKDNKPKAIQEHKHYNWILFGKPQD